MYIEESKGERLKRLIDESHFKNASQLSKTSGVPYTTIKSFIDRDLNKAAIDSVVKLAKALNVSVEYLIGEDVPNPNTVNESVSTYHYFPQSISAGIPLRVDGVTEANKIEVPNSVLGKWAGHSDLFMMRVNGDSMNKIIPDQSLIAVKPVELHQIKSGDIVVYSDDGDYSVKRMYQDNDKIIFRPDSHDTSFYDYVTSVDNSNLVIHGKVVVYIVELD